MTAVQRLYDIRNASFTSTGPISPEVLQNVCDILDTIKPADVGLEEQALVFRGWNGSPFGINGKKGRNGIHRYMPPITYLHIHECERFWIEISYMPTSSIIPLHNCPGMKILSKLLYGSMHAKAFDWINPSEATDSSKAKLAKLVKDCEMSAPCDTSGAADAILALRSKHKENSWIRGVAKYQRLPIFVMDTNMMAEMVRAMWTILGLETLGASSFSSLKKFKNDIEISDGAAKRRSSREEIDALEEARLAIEYIVIPGGQPVELLPRCADIIARQINLVESYQLVTEKSGR